MPLTLPAEQTFAGMLQKLRTRADASSASPFRTVRR